MQKTDSDRAYTYQTQKTTSAADVQTKQTQMAIMDPKITQIQISKLAAVLHLHDSAQSWLGNMLLFGFKRDTTAKPSKQNTNAGSLGRLLLFVLV